MVESGTELGQSILRTISTEVTAKMVRRDNPPEDVMACHFEPLQNALAKLPAQDAILDGDVVCLDQNGMSRLNALLERRKAPVFYAFVLLWFDGADLKDLLLIERKNRLSELVQSSGCNRLLYAQHIEEYWRHFFKESLRTRFGKYRCQTKNEHLQAWWEWMAQDQKLAG